MKNISSYSLIIPFLLILLYGCKEEICPDVCSIDLKLKTSDNCSCLCKNEDSFDQLMFKWDRLKLCIHKFNPNEKAYILLSHYANNLTCGRTDYLLLYRDIGSEVPHPQIPDAKQGFFRINHYGEFTRDLWGYTKYVENDTLYIGHGLNPSVSNRSFLCNEPQYHSGKLFFSDGKLNWNKKIYDSAENWEMEANPGETHYLSFFLLEPVD